MNFECFHEIAQWIINSRTIVENIEYEESPLKPPDYNIIPFNQLDIYKDTDAEVDILAIAMMTNAPRQVNTSHGKSLVQDIYVIDSSLKVLRLAMWNKFVHDECSEICNIIMEKPIVLATKIRVSSYNGLSLSSRPTSVFTIEPFLASAISLRAWATEDNLLLEETIAKNLDRPVASTSGSSTDPLVKISEIVEALKSIPAMTRSTFMVRGKFTISDLHQPFFYLSCAKCSKTTGYEKDEEFLCYNCKEQTTAKPRRITRT
ncbi:hypothetical protein F2P56_025784 [Juglans regia]|uniref:Replication protein A OB domain-containing protein n=1 Tax=Juglans regia TaxID=51240 RepID=A0A833UPV5_JUGRE|nr:hypothetical protein F2P56_025784 [Juglans regia]